MTEDRLEELLGRFGGLSIGVVGDFCVDAYWLIDNTNVERSIETGLPTRAVCRQSYSLGGAGNVLSNVAALGVGTVCAFGVIGDDVFGREMLDLQRRLGPVDLSGMIEQREDWNTCVYAKPYVDLDELERIDFGRFNQIRPETERALLAALERALPGLDGLIVNQQLRPGIHSEGFIAGLNALIADRPDKAILLDARDVADRYTGVICKVNAGEAARLCGDAFEVTQAITEEALDPYARAITERTGRPVVITRSDRGILAFDGSAFCAVPGILMMGQIDPVGAGDTTGAVIATALAAGATLAEAIELGNYGGSIVVQKLRQTGTAGPDELRRMARECQYVYRPELAEDIRKATCVEGTEIELVNASAPCGSITHVIFDHDGTISTLRQGWEEIMEPVMVRAVLGEQFEQAPEELYHRVVRRVQEYIDKSTGIETIRQMEALGEMVRQFGLVREEEILDAMGYKAIYNQALMDRVHGRLAKLAAGELDVADFTVKGAVQFVRALSERGLTLYLASGTDHEDVVAEAEALGYARYFSGGIHGWAGVGSGSAKQMVIEGILKQFGLSGPEFACVGDGPVELRLAKRFGGIAVGVAGDELRRWGLNAHKRTRLVKAGADVIVPDFSQRERLMARVFGGEGA